MLNVALKRALDDGHCMIVTFSTYFWDTTLGDPRGMALFPWVDGVSISPCN